MNTSSLLRPPRRRLRLRGPLLAFGAASILVGSVAVAVWARPDVTADLPEVRQARILPPQPASYADVVEPAMRAVVNVSGIGSSQGSWMFFDGDGPRGVEGSGVIVREDGIILTNHHVVEGARRVRVTLADGTEHVAKVIGRDPPTDLAVLDVDATDLPTLPFGVSGGLRTGDLVFAIGNPLGIGQTASMGIVSATSQQGLGVTEYDDLIVTDAAINPGNSGGALLDGHGRLVGINTAILFRGRASFQGIGLAVPVDMARRVLDQILSEGKVTRGFLGVELRELDASLARRAGLDRPAGARIQTVQPGTPADRAGLRAGDVIVDVAGESVGSVKDAQLAIAKFRPGSRVRLGLVRDGETKRIVVDLAARAADVEREVEPDWSSELASSGEWR